MTVNPTLTRVLGLALAAAGLLGSTAPAGAIPHAESPRLVGPNDPGYQARLEALRRARPLHGDDPTTAGSLWTTFAPAIPVERQRLAFSLRPEFQLFYRASEPQLQLTPIHQGIRDDKDVDPAFRARVALLLDLSVAPHTSAHLRFSFDSEGKNDVRNRTRDFDQLGASNNLDEAYLRFANERVAFLLGRRPLSWGPERLGGLILGPGAPAPDLLEAQLRWADHRLHFFVGQLSQELGAADPAPTLQRLLYGHRTDLYFLDRALRIGLAETALVAGENASLNLRYLNPVSFWTQVQVEEDGASGTQVNVFNSVDLTWWAKPGLRLYGTFLVDDLQIDDLGRKRNPDQLAWTSGADWTPSPDSRWTMGYEYRRIGTWTYLHRGEGTDYQQYEHPLGAEEGPDTDRHNLRIDWKANMSEHSELCLFVEGERRRRGENHLDTDDPRAGSSGAPFPLGIVEKRWIAKFGARFQWNDAESVPYAKAALGAAFHGVENINNHRYIDRDIWEVTASVTFRLPALAADIERD